MPKGRHIILYAYGYNIFCGIYICLHMVGHLRLCKTKRTIAAYHFLITVNSSIRLATLPFEE